MQVANNEGGRPFRPCSWSTERFCQGATGTGLDTSSRITKWSEVLVGRVGMSVGVLEARRRGYVQAERSKRRARAGTGKRVELRWLVAVLVLVQS